MAQWDGFKHFLGEAAKGFGHGSKQSWKAFADNIGEAGAHGLSDIAQKGALLIPAAVGIGASFLTQDPSFAFMGIAGSAVAFGGKSMIRGAAGAIDGGIGKAFPDSTFRLTDKLKSGSNFTSFNHISDEVLQSGAYQKFAGTFESRVENNKGLKFLFNSLDKFPENDMRRYKMNTGVTASIFGVVGAAEGYGTMRDMYGQAAPQPGYVMDGNQLMQTGSVNANNAFASSLSRGLR